MLKHNHYFFPVLEFGLIISVISTLINFYFDFNYNNNLYIWLFLNLILTIIIIFLIDIYYFAIHGLARNFIFQEFISKSYRKLFIIILIIFIIWNIYGLILLVIQENIRDYKILLFNLIMTLVSDLLVSVLLFVFIPFPKFLRVAQDNTNNNI